MCIRKYRIIRLKRLLKIEKLKVKIADTKNKHQFEKPDNWWLRNLIAIIITGFVVIITVIIAVYEMWFTSAPNMDFIGKSLLPLWGTWIGTVLAFYFGKSNFDAVSSSYQAAIKALTPEDKIAQLPVKDIMIPVNQLQYLVFDEEKGNKIKDILALPRFAMFNRFAVFESNRILKCIIHRSTFNQFIVNKLNDIEKKSKVDELILQDIIDEKSPVIKNMLINGFNFIHINANLLDAKKALDAKPECLDIFVTANGKSTEPVMGLITNNMILEKLKV
jgi:hypothetical protein